MTKVKCPNCGIEFELPKCKTCVYLNGEKKSVGIECTCPNKQWLRPVAKYKNPNQFACLYYVADINKIEQFHVTFTIGD